MLSSFMCYKIPWGCQPRTSWARKQSFGDSGSLRNVGFNSPLTWLIDWEDFLAVIRRECLKSYKVPTVIEAFLAFTQFLNCLNNDLDPNYIRRWMHILVRASEFEFSHLRMVPVMSNFWIKYSIGGVFDICGDCVIASSWRILEVLARLLGNFTKWGFLG
jgi:hypothetical protein